MSAILPPKRPSRTPLKLSLSSTSGQGSSSSSEIQAPTIPQEAGSSSAPRVPPVPTRPALKLGQLSSSLGGLSLSIPSTSAPSPAAAASRNAPRSPDSDDEDGQAKAWGKEDQQRSVGELLDVIRGPGAEDDAGGLRPGAARARSSSRGVVGPPPPPLRLRSGNAGEAYGGENGMIGVATPTSAEFLQPTHARVDSRMSVGTPSTPGSAGGVEVELEVGPEHLKDLGRLGEGASGEVRKVVHVKSGIIMAKKVSAAMRLVSRSSLTPSGLADDRDLPKSQSTQAAPARALVHAGLFGPAHRAVLRCFPRGR